MERVYGTCLWNVFMERVYGTCLWNVFMERVYGTCFMPKQKRPAKMRGVLDWVNGFLQDYFLLKKFTVDTYSDDVYTLG